MEAPHNKKVRMHTAGGTMGHSLSDYYPLLGMLVVVVLLTLGGVYWLSQNWMLAFMGYFL